MARTVLIVDDHAAFRSFARTLLESEGFEVIREAGDGASALEAAGRTTCRAAPFLQEPAAAGRRRGLAGAPPRRASGRQASQRPTNAGAWGPGIRVGWSLA